MTVERIFRVLNRRMMKYIVHPVVGVFRESAWSIPGIRVERIGSAYGGGWIAPDLLSPQSVAYSIGIGCDITFDDLLIRKTGCTVFGFDPTPKSAEWIRTYPHVPQKFTFVPVGLADTTGRRKLYLPSNKEFVSGSITQDLHGGYVECDFCSLDDLMCRQNHSFIDLLKIDIEGAEFALFDQWIYSAYHPPVGQIWVEFHPVLVGRQSSDAARLVRELGRIDLVPMKRAYRQNPDHYLLINRKFLDDLQAGKSGK